jgi:uncharacterized membrane protein YphA (DoxX/SURF4 family)
VTAQDSVARPAPFGARPWVRTVSTLLRLGLGAVWLVAGSLKVGDAAGMVRSVRAFRILPESLVHPVAYAVPFVEIALGGLLLLGLAVRVAALLSALACTVYIVAIASAAARGLRIECGCFSSGGDLAKNAPTHYTSDLVRDSLLLLASLLLATWPDGYLTMDRLLFGPPPMDGGYGADNGLDGPRDDDTASPADTAPPADAAPRDDRAPRDDVAPRQDAAPREDADTSHQRPDGSARHSADNPSAASRNADSFEDDAAAGERGGRQTGHRARRTVRPRPTDRATRMRRDR